MAFSTVAPPQRARLRPPRRVAGGRAASVHSTDPEWAGPNGPIRNGPVRMARSEWPESTPWERTMPEDERAADRWRLAGTVALVTGASSGIGEATAQSLVAEGASVALV
ncbi:MAG TPA: SDR family NAD(P)-dependent oxidoreductase, partial [Acidimicrobiales bacterium]